MSKLLFGSLKKYFTEGILPKPNRTIIEITEGDMQPLIQRSRENLPSTWTTLLQHLENSPNYVRRYRQMI